MIDDLFISWIPVQPFPAPVRLRCHDAHQRVRKAMVDVGIGRCARLHGLEPVGDMDHAVVIGTARVWRLSSWNLHNLLAVLWPRDDRNLRIDCSPAFRIELVQASLPGDCKQRGTLATIILDGAGAALNPRKTPVT